MKNNLLFSVMVAASLLTLAFSSTSYADAMALDDNALYQVEGKAGAGCPGHPNPGNCWVVSSNPPIWTFDVTVMQTGLDSNANVQWGVEQWTDYHTTDVSYTKGGNRFDGSAAAVCAWCTTINNGIFWGALGQTATRVGTVYGDLTAVGYGTFAAAGF